MTAFHLPTATPDLYLARHLHAPTTVTIDGADSRNPERTAEVTLCPTCSDKDEYGQYVGAKYDAVTGQPTGEYGIVLAPCDTAKALGVRG